MPEDCRTRFGALDSRLSSSECCEALCLLTASNAGFISHDLVVVRGRQETQGSRFPQTSFT